MSEATNVAIPFEGSVGEFLAELAKMGKAGETCTLVYQGEEIGAFIPMEEYLFLRQVAAQEAEAEAKQEGSYTHGEHQPEAWLPWSATRRKLAAEVVPEGEADAVLDP
jgi:hypothetical protein